VASCTTTSELHNVDTDCSLYAAPIHLLLLPFNPCQALSITGTQTRIGSFHNKLLLTCSLQHRCTCTLCSEKYPFTFSSISPWMMC